MVWMVWRMKCVFTHISRRTEKHNHSIMYSWSLFKEHLVFYNSHAIDVCSILFHIDVAWLLCEPYLNLFFMYFCRTLVITCLPSLIVKILGHHSFSFTQTCLGFRSRNSHLGRFLKFIEMFGFLTICFVIKATAYVNSTADTKQYY